MSAIIPLLQESYQDVTRKNGLIDFTKKIRTDENDLSGKYSVTQQELSSLFSSVVWKETKTSNGHRKFTHRITKVVVEYKNHGNSEGIDPGAAQRIFENVQEHINKLGNEIFKFGLQNWKTLPDYNAASKRLQEAANKG